MKSLAFAILALALAPVVASAIPLIKPGCNDSSYDRGFRDLVHKVGIIDEDSRKEVAELVDQGVLTKSEETRIRATFGNIECPVYRWDPVKKREVYYKHSVGSAAIVYDKQTVITAAHVFYDKELKTPLKYLSKCRFRNREVPALVIPLKLADGMLGGPKAKLENPGRIVLGTLDPFAQKNQDRAAVRLAAPVENAQPFEYDTSDAYPTERTNALINISVPHEDLADAKEAVDPHYTYKAIIGQQCTNRDTYPALPRITPVMKIDCDSYPGASGSILLTRSGDPDAGPLKAVGIVVQGTNEPHLKGTPFDLYSHFTRALAINSLFHREIQTAAGKTGVQTADVSN